MGTDVIDVARVLVGLTRMYATVGLLLYGRGLRLTGCVTLRVKQGRSGIIES